METKLDDLPRVDVKKTSNLRLTLPVPISINHMYQNTRGGGKRLTKEAENYVRVSRAIINREVQDQKWKLKDKGIWTYIDMVYYMPDKRIRDASNCLKLLLDVMEGIIYTNDMYAIPRIQSVELDRDNPRLEIKVNTQTKADRVKILSQF